MPCASACAFPITQPIGVHWPWTNGIHGNAIGRQVERRGLRQSEHGEFGSGIGRTHGAGSLGSVRGNIDDAPSLPLADHDLPDELGAQEDGGGINSQEMLPDIFPTP